MNLCLAWALESGQGWNPALVTALLDAPRRLLSLSSVKREKGQLLPGWWGAVPPNLSIVRSGGCVPAQGAVMVVGSLVPFSSTSLVVRVSCVKATTPHLCLVLIMSSDDLKSHVCTFAHQPWRRRRPTSLPRLEPGWLQALRALCPLAAPTCMFLMHRPEPSCCLSQVCEVVQGHQAGTSCVLSSPGHRVTSR